MKKKVCVIGASGVVGSHVVQCALRKGYKVKFRLFKFLVTVKAFLKTSKSGDFLSVCVIFHFHFNRSMLACGIPMTT